MRQIMIHDNHIQGSMDTFCERKVLEMNRINPLAMKKPVFGSGQQTQQ